MGDTVLNPKDINLYVEIEETALRPRVPLHLY